MVWMLVPLLACGSIVNVAALQALGTNDALCTTLARQYDAMAGTFGPSHRSLRCLSLVPQ